MTEDEFWSATDQLNLIHQWARASYVAPWALLCAVLLRVIASTGHPVMLPGPPAPASLNMGLVLIGRSGSGKGVTDKLSRVVWPADIHEEGLGSGQGIAELFKEQKNPEDRITRALVSVSEIDHLTALNAGQGNNTRAALKAALTGDRLGSKGASVATSRSVPADSYRLCLSISAQFGHCGVLLDDVSGGTPQRQVWVLVTDPDMPDEPGPTPDRVLDTSLPSWALSGSQTLMQYGTPEIREYVAAGLLANQRGQLDAIDGHRTLTRLKVAAALAILDHRMVISAIDWELSEHIMAKSDATRAAVIEYDRQAARAKVRDRALGRAAFDEIIEGRHTATVRNRVVRLLADGPMSRSDLRRAMGKQHYREAFDALLPHLEKISQVLVVQGDKAPHYALNPEFTGEPEFTPENTSSTGVNHEFTGEPQATVTDLDSRRSHDTQSPKLTAREWFATHIADLRRQNHDTVHAFAVYSAGIAQGYDEDTIKVIASNTHLIHAIGRTARRDSRDATWCLRPKSCNHPPPRSAAAWLQEWAPANMGSRGLTRSEVVAAGSAEPEEYSEDAILKAKQLCPQIVSTGVGRGARWVWSAANEGEVTA